MWRGARLDVGLLLGGVQPAVGEGAGHEGKNPAGGHRRQVQLVRDLDDVRRCGGGGDNATDSIKTPGHWYRITGVRRWWR